MKKKHTQSQPTRCIHSRRRKNEKSTWTKVAVTFVLTVQQTFWDRFWAFGNVPLLELWRRTSLNDITRSRSLHDLVNESSWQMWAYFYFGRSDFQKLNGFGRSQHMLKSTGLGEARQAA